METLVSNQCNYWPTSEVVVEYFSRITFTEWKAIVGTKLTFVRPKKIV